MQNLAIVFPGQGSQKVGMMDSVSSQYALVHTLFQKASDVLGYDLWQIVSHGPAEQLNSTIYTQPAMLVADVAMWQILQEKHADVQPKYLAGHSLGEISALVAANALAFEPAVKLVAIRAKLMQEAVKPGEGAMAAVLGLADGQVASICESIQPVQSVAPANFNSPGQVVIAGTIAAIDEVMQKAKEMGGKAIKLPVSVPSHSPLMREAAMQFAHEINQFTFNMPEIPIIHNVDAKISHHITELKDRLVQQLYSPVCWTESILFMAQQGVTQIIECGPGSILANLIKRIDKEIQVINPY